MLIRIMTAHDRNPRGVAGRTQGAARKGEGDSPAAATSWRAQRQELPWVRVDEEYLFETDEGPRTLADLFDGRPS